VRALKKGFLPFLNLAPFTIRMTKQYDDQSKKKIPGRIYFMVSFFTDPVQIAPSDGLVGTSPGILEDIRRTYTWWHSFQPVNEQV
jgi:hypothetical protein